MLCKADAIGVFQVETRAQMNMLPRLKPSEFYDLVIEVAIVRPGRSRATWCIPICAGGRGWKRPDLPSPSPEHGAPDELKQVLGKTLGVPLFQEQAMKLAIVAAKFTPEEANGFAAPWRRSAMPAPSIVSSRRWSAAWWGAAMTPDFAERCFKQIEGFGTYGFPESHAASFALLVYVSAWMKCHHPAVFACALLNSQPMGFYAPAQIVRDAREHGVEVRAIDVAASEWDCTLEDRCAAPGLPSDQRIFAGVGGAACRDPSSGLLGFAELVRMGLPRAALVSLAEADALRSLKLDRRAALWQVRGLSDMTDLPLFAHQPVAIHHVPLPVMTKGEHVITDYQTTGLSLKIASDALSARVVHRRRRSELRPGGHPSRWYEPSPSPAWCWCVSAQAMAMSYSAPSRTRPASPISWSGPAC